MLLFSGKSRGIVVSLICLLLVALNTVKANARTGGDFILTDHNYKNFELNQLRGNVVLLFFGYTSCPDVCPTELGKVAQALNAFENTSNNVKGLFITVDPERDTPEVLKQYVSYFSKQLQGLTGSREQIDKVTKQYRASYRISHNSDTIIVDHSTNLYVIDKEGDLDTIIPFGMSARHIIRVVNMLLEQE